MFTGVVVVLALVGVFMVGKAFLDSTNQSYLNSALLVIVVLIVVGAFAGFVVYSLVYVANILVLVLSGDELVKFGNVVLYLLVGLGVFVALVAQEYGHSKLKVMIKEMENQDS